MPAQRTAKREAAEDDKAAPAKRPKKPTEHWTPEDEAALVKALFELGIKSIPILHESSGLKGKKTNPSVNNKLRGLLKRYEKDGHL